MFFMDKGILVSIVFLFPLRTRSQTRNTIIVINRKHEKATYMLAGERAALSSPLAIALQGFSLKKEETLLTGIDHPFRTF